MNCDDSDTMWEIRVPRKPYRAFASVPSSSRVRPWECQIINYPSRLRAQIVSPRSMSSTSHGRDVSMVVVSLLFLYLRFFSSEHFLEVVGGRWSNRHCTPSWAAVTGGWQYLVSFLACLSWTWCCLSPSVGWVSLALPKDQRNDVLVSSYV